MSTYSIYTHELLNLHIAWGVYVYIRMYKGKGRRKRAIIESIAYF